MLLSAAGGLAAVDADAVAEPELCEFAPDPTFSIDGDGVVHVGGTHGNDVIAAYVAPNGLLTVHVNDVIFA
ncbi:MAG: hypothetical protein GY826_08970, partial [Fuerstiella sp.]|nr:hypothetical protein [Fuerstiella sp.]